MSKFGGSWEGEGCNPNEAFKREDNSCFVLKADCAEVTEVEVCFRPWKKNILRVHKHMAEI